MGEILNSKFRWVYFFYYLSFLSLSSIHLVSLFSSHLFHTKTLSSRISFDVALIILLAQKHFPSHPAPNTTKFWLINHFIRCNNKTIFYSLLGYLSHNMVRKIFLTRKGMAILNVTVLKFSNTTIAFL